jgi:hypothetical protein
MILRCGHFARVHPTASGPLPRLPHFTRERARDNVSKIGAGELVPRSQAVNRHPGVQRRLEVTHDNPSPRRLMIQKRK